MWIKYLIYNNKKLTITLKIYREGLHVEFLDEIRDKINSH